MPARPAPRRPKSISLLAAFLLAAAIIALVTGASLLRPGTALDRLWQLNPRAYGAFALLGCSAAGLLLLLSSITAAAGIGLLRRQRWAWFVAIAVFAANGLGDMISLFSRDRMKSAAGVLIAGCFLFLLLRPRVRLFFSGRS